MRKKKKKQGSGRRTGKSPARRKQPLVYLHSNQHETTRSTLHGETDDRALCTTHIYSMARESTNQRRAHTLRGCEGCVALVHVQARGTTFSDEMQPEPFGGEVETSVNVSLSVTTRPLCPSLSHTVPPPPPPCHISPGFGLAITQTYHTSYTRSSYPSTPRSYTSWGHAPGLST